MKNPLIFAACACFSLTSAFSQNDTWTNGNGTESWSDGANWSESTVPLSNTVAYFSGTSPFNSSNSTAVDGSVEVGGLNFALTNTIFTLEASGFSGTLQINGDITNTVGGTGIPTFNVPVIVGANSVWNGFVSFGGLVNIQQFQVSLNGAGINFNPGSQLTFGIGTGISDYGKFAGTTALGSTANSTITVVINGTYTGAEGDTFDFAANGGFSGAALDLSGAVLDVGLTWDQSNFLTNGTLSVVAIPEPATWALLIGGASAFFLIRRRRNAEPSALL